MSKTLHEQYIDELLGGRVSLTPREMAAANEIQALRAKLAKQEEKPASKKLGK
jgi:hypothetical protein